MKYGIALLASLAIAASGCGSNNPPAEGPGHEHGDAEHEHAEHGEEHHNLAGPVADFHAVLAPIWHSPEGEGRQTKACEQAQAMHDKAAAVEAAPAPAGANGDEYKAGAKALTAAVDDMAAECKKTPVGGVEAKLSTVHDAFHKVAELGGAHEEHHEPHEH